MPSEGQTAIGPKGQRAVFRGGQWVVAGAPQQPQMPADPSFPYEGAQAAAQAANTGAQAQVNAATVPAQIASANAEATTKTRTSRTAGLPEGFMWDESGETAVPIPGYTRQGLSPEIRANAIQAFSDANALERAADDLERLYQAGPGATKGAKALYDYLPSDTNKVFNDTGQQARGYVKRALGFTGGEGNTVAESSALYDPYLPNTWDRDAQIVNKIERLRQLANDARIKSTTTLGGTPDAAGNITPAQELPNAMTRARAVEGGGPGAAPAGSQTQGIPVDPRYQAEFSQWVQGKGGNFSPAEYNAMRRGLDQKYGYAGTGDYTSEAQTVLEGFKTGRTVNLTIPPIEQPLSGMEQFRNNLVNNPVGAAAAGALDMGGFGLPSAMAGEQYAALSEANPVATTLGQIGGSIGGTAMLGKAAAETTARLAPALLGGGAKGALARGVGTDAAYSGIYGSTTGQDPLESAAFGTLGSLGGRAVGKVAGRAIGGLDVSPAVQRLKARGIPMTVPQQIGGFAKNVEEKAMSLPLIGDMIGARYGEGLNAMNRQAFTEAGAPIGAAVSNIGEEGIQDLTGEIGNAYNRATAGTRVPFDSQFATDFENVAAMGQALPDDYRPLFGKVLQNRVVPLTDAGEMTGEQYQQAMRGLKGKRNSAGTATPGFEEEWRGALTGTMDALEGQMMRGGGQNVVEGLTAANAANRNKGALANAVRASAGGSQSGESFVFTPNQLQRAGLATQTKYPGPRPFAELADDAQTVLARRVPDSGTAGRVAQMALPAGLAGGGAGLGFAAGGDLQGAQSGATTGALLTAALLLGGTRGGQKALEKALIGRPVKAQMLGRAIRDRRGLFGSAALPLMISEY